MSYLSPPQQTVVSAEKTKYLMQIKSKYQTDSKPGTVKWVQPDTCEDHATRGCWRQSDCLIMSTSKMWKPTKYFAASFSTTTDFLWAPCDQWLEKVKYPKLYRSIGFIIGSTFTSIIISSVFWIDRFSNIYNSSCSLERLSSFVTSANKDQGRVIIYLLFGWCPRKQRLFLPPYLPRNSSVNSQD